jgi:hypothetical protein
MTMSLKHTRVQHEGAGHWVVDFVGDDGEAVSVKVTDHELSDEDRIVAQAKRVMIELTGFGTRGGKPTLNRYDALSNGDLEDDNVALKTTH